MRNLVNVLAWLALVVVVAPRAGRSQTSAEMQAAQETELPGLRLVDDRLLDSRLILQGVRLGYLEKDTRPGETGRYFCGALAGERRAAAAQNVALALAKVPYVAVRRLGLRYVILCGGAKDGDRPIGGIPVPPLDLLMLDVGGSDDAAFLQRATLHELYHLVEFRFNTIRDADWEREFSGYSNRYAPELLKGSIGSGKPGFLNAYAETFPHEDRAELFEALVFDPAAVLDRIKATNDTVLWHKVQYLDQESQRLLGLKLVPDGR